MSIDNLRSLFEKADATDLSEGALAYGRYHSMLQSIANHYEHSMEQVVAAFVALSPNNDYLGNLRSLVSVLQGIKQGVPSWQITVSTYNHCRNRAYTYLTGEVEFLARAKGPKIRSFYFNIMDPSDTRHVTIDGHIHAAWQNDPLMTMKDAILRCQKDYDRIKTDIQQLAFEHFLIPNQLQAILWFTRKRILRIVYDPQVDIFNWSRGDIWNTLRDVTTIAPYKRKLG